MKTDLLCCFDELFIENLGLILESVCLSLIAEETFCTVGRIDMVEEKVVEVFRRHHDGDPWRLRRTPVALPMFGWIVNVYRHHSWAARRCLCKGDNVKRLSGVGFSPVPSTVCAEVDCFMRTLCLHWKKNRLSCACGQW